MTPRAVPMIPVVKPALATPLDANSAMIGLLDKKYSGIGKSNVGIQDQPRRRLVIHFLCQDSAVLLFSMPMIPIGSPHENRPISPHATYGAN